MNKSNTLIAMKKTAQSFLSKLDKEEYEILSYQWGLFKQYEHFLTQIFQLPIEDLDQETALCFAQVLIKGANIYRRRATEQSLKLALDYHQRALDIRKKWLDAHALELAESLVYKGATYNELKGIENNIKAIECYKQGLAIYEYHQESGKRYKASTLFQLGNAYRDLDEKNIPRAIIYIDRALQIFDTLPHDHILQREKAKALYNQGVNYHRLGGVGNSRKAIDYLNSAKILFELNHDTARYALTLSYLGNVYNDLGNENISLSIDLLQQALHLQKELFGDECSAIATTLFYLARAHLNSGENKNPSMALEHLKNALKIQKRFLGTTHPDIARTAYYLGLKYLENNLFDKGIFLIQEAFSIFKLLPLEHHYLQEVKKSFLQLRALLTDYNSKEAKIILQAITHYLTVI